MSWLDGNARLDQPYGLAEYREHTAGIDVAAMVYLQVEVEPAYGLLEAAWAAERAREDPRLRAVVAWAPLEDGEPARAYLDALVKISPLIKGVRRVTQGEPDVDFVARPGFVRAVRLLPQYGLSCDVCIYHPQLPGVIVLVRQCPEVSFVLDPWRAQIRELASLPNVSCKVSGLVTEADHRNWTRDDLAPYVEHVLASFGEDRVMFGGDWPVVTQAATYRRWVETLDDLTKEMAEPSRKKLWADNARKFYRLG